MQPGWRPALLLALRAEADFHGLAKWIEAQREERNADALAWVIQRAAFALTFCYPPGQGREILWGLFRKVAGQE